MSAIRPTPRARRRFGQHFLEAPWVAKVVSALEPGPRDVFLEIGPGRGALTRPLAAVVRGVIAYEIDRDLAETLRVTAGPNVRVVPHDFLRVSSTQVVGDLAALGSSDVTRLRAAGNLPYNVGSPILFQLLDLRESEVPLEDATVMVQREVADRLLAVPGSRAYGVLSVMIQHRARVERLLELPPGAFRPSPKVRSTLVRLRFHEPDPPVRDPDTFAAMTRSVFSRRRKTISNALRTFVKSPWAAAQVLKAAGVDPGRRPESLDVEDFVNLSDACGRHAS